MAKRKQRPPPPSTTSRDDALFSLAILLEKFQIVQIVKYDPFDFKTFGQTLPPTGVLLTKLTSGTSWYMVAL